MRRRVPSFGTTVVIAYGRYRVRFIRVRSSRRDGVVTVRMGPVVYENTTTRRHRPGYNIGDHGRWRLISYYRDGGMTAVFRE